MRICSLSGKSMEEEDFLYEDLSRELTTHYMNELIIGMRDFNRHVGRNSDEFLAFYGGLSIGE